MSNVVVFDIATLGVLMIILAHLYSSFNTTGIYNRYLKHLVWAAVCGTLLEIISYLIWDLGIYIPNTGLYLIVCCYCASYMILGILYASMNVVVFELYDMIKKVYKILFFIPFIAGITMLILTPFTGIVFYLSETGKFHRGIGYYIYAAMPITYLLFGICCVWRYRRFLAKTVYRKMNKVYSLVICFAFVNIYEPNLLSTFLSIGFGLLILVLENSNMSEFIDGRTQLYNRKFLKTKLLMRLNSTEPFRFYVIKVDDVSVFHSNYDDEAEENLIKHLSKYFKNIFEHCVCYQLSDFSFLNIVTDNEQFDEQKVLEQCMEKFSKVFKSDSHEYKLSVKIGVLNYPLEVRNEAEIMEAVDCICRSESEELGMHLIRIDEEKFQKYKRGIKIENLINEKLKTNGFQVYFQPIYSIKEQRISSAEALVRLYDDELGFVSPDEFIPISERNGTIIEIGKYVFEEVCKFISEHEVEQYGIKFVEINLSPVQCMQSKLAGQLMEIMKAYKVSSDRINLEITETVAAHMKQELKENMQNLSTSGVKFSMDDFGTGYSNMSSVIHLPFQFVKLDKSIVWSAFENSKAYTVMQSSIQMFKKLDLEVIAEGIEKEEQLEQALSMGCDYIQGYYYSKPLPKIEFVNYMTSLKPVAESLSL